MKGFNSPVKRHKILSEIQSYDAGIVFLQETHLAQDSGIRIYSRKYPTWFYGDSPNRRAKGVAIGFAKILGSRLRTG